MTTVELPVPVLSLPHWRVNYRPALYDSARLGTIAECVELIRSTKLSLRGWDYPHLSNKPDQITIGNTWAASWVQFMNHIEYWRMYQSGQFLHLFAVREAAEPEWTNQLRRAAASHAYGHDTTDWDAVPGYLSLLNVLYTVTEIFEFAARIAQRGVYQESVSISIELTRIGGFVLTPETERTWSGVRRASQSKIGRTWNVDATELVASSAELARDASGWLFERFGWLHPAMEILRKDQQKFLEGRL
jgi:hypothetical protein